MGPGTPPYFLAQLVCGSVFLEYLSHTYLIPSRLTKTISSSYERHLRKPRDTFSNQYLQELGGETMWERFSIVLQMQPGNRAR
jgi:hypothetical protein